MFIVTGGAGFIGSAFVAKLNAEGISNIIIVDAAQESRKSRNLHNKKFTDYLDRDSFLALVENNKLPQKIEAIVHMGACSSTTETDVDYLTRNNYQYTRVLAEYAQQHKIRYIYASSGATYGAGELGFDDRDDLVPSLKPLNPYGDSKQTFDLWALRKNVLKEIVGLKFFNVYGPNEYFKGEMRSVVHKSFEQIQKSGQVSLFKSLRPDFKDGEQKRDFIYVKDCSDVMWWLINNRNVNGLFNLGSGHARTWKDLVRAVFTALGREPNIKYIDLPDHLAKQYQYFTEAKIEKLSKTGCPTKFRSLEDGVRDYVVNYLIQEDPTY